MHFLRHFQQRCPRSVVHASIPPLPAVWRMHHTAHHHPKLQWWLVQGSGAPSHPTSRQPRWSSVSAGQEEESVHGSPPHWGFRSGLDPKKSKPTSQTQDPAQAARRRLHQTTQPLPALFSLGFWSKPQPTIFLMPLAEGPSHQAGDTDGHGFVHGPLPQARRWLLQPPRDVAAFQWQIALK